MTVSQTSDNLRVAIVGAGRMAHHHATAVSRAMPRGRVVAVADPSNDAVKAFTAAFPGTAGFETVDAMLESQLADVVHIVSPPSTHAELGRKVLEAGRHVYIEKPFTENVADAIMLLELAATKQLKVCAGHQLLFEHPSVKLAELSPALRELTHIESYFSFRPVRHAAGGRTPLRQDLQLLDILPHPVYLLLTVLERAEPDGEAELCALELSRGATVHATIRRGGVAAHLVVTLEGRPVENYLRLVGANGSLTADYVRGTVHSAIGPGSSGIDKALAPYRLAWQAGWGTTAALTRRVLKRQRSYPGLAELFGAFYASIGGGRPPVSAGSILDTVRVCASIRDRINEQPRTHVTRPFSGQGVLVTGGTGFLGKAIVHSLIEQNHAVRCVARRDPPSWERIDECDYRVADLALPLDHELFQGIGTVVHCAAATAGGWEEHQRYSINATENVLRGAASAGVTRIIHVSSLAVQARSGTPLTEDGAYPDDSRGSGPYVWGKLESEKIALQLGTELQVDVRVVRPGAIIDYDAFDPPGRLGKRLGGVFVAVGSPGHRLATTELGFAARAISWMVGNWADVPGRLNLLDPDSPTKRDLVARLRKDNPGLTVIWLPNLVLYPLSWFATFVQKMRRPRATAISLARVFGPQTVDTSRSRELAARMQGMQSGERVAVASNS